MKERKEGEEREVLWFGVETASLTPQHEQEETVA